MTDDASLVMRVYVHSPLLQERLIAAIRIHRGGNAAPTGMRARVHRTFTRLAPAKPLVSETITCSLGVKPLNTWM